ncbi:MAG: HAD family hydrolase [Muribaculum sp.]|nr:HAD family hydrolase [Muribaculum sp.]
MIEAVIFDFDGTLADTTDAIVDTVRLTLQELKLPLVDDNAIKALIGLPLIECMRQVTGYTSLHEVARATDIYRRIWPDVSESATRLFPNVANTMRQLKERGLTLAIATSRSRISVLQMLDTLGLAPLISTVRADEDVANKKPAPDMVLSILDELNIPADNAITVGDTTFDITMGTKAGTATIGVSYGNHSKERLATARPDNIIDDFADILRFI